MRIQLGLNSVESYAQFLRIKSLPSFRFSGRVAEFPDEYAGRVGLEAGKPISVKRYMPLAGMFDYQKAAAVKAISKRKFAVFMGCGLGKTLVMTEFARYVSSLMPADRVFLIVSPLMVVRQTMAETERFYGKKLKLQQVRAAELPNFLKTGTGIGITNYEAVVDGLPSDRVFGIALDESSLLKSHYGKWGTRLIQIGRGVEWKLALTGTPAPNDRIEYANHAVFLDHFPTVNSFLARYFVNRGQTGERWELKPHALHPFYRSLSHWALFMSDPSVYGFKDNCTSIPPIRVHMHYLDMSEEQTRLAAAESKSLFPTAGGIVSRAKLAQIAKGNHNGKKIETSKPKCIVEMVESWPDEQTIIWCKYNREQDELAELIPDAANISGDTPDEKRLELIGEFQSGQRRVLISKPKILGFGLNLQMATRMIFSTLQDSYEEYFQAVKRANRVGSAQPLNVHLPMMEIERPMVENVLRKARMVEQDIRQQEEVFREESKIN